MTSISDNNKTKKHKTPISVFSGRKLKGSTRLALILIAALLTFGGPTYLIYLLRNILPYSFLVLLGSVCLVVGFVLFLSIFWEEEKK